MAPRLESAQLRREPDPPLTTVFVSTDQIGVISGEYLVARANDKPVLRVNQIPTKLAVRASARPATRALEHHSTPRAYHERSDLLAAPDRRALCEESIDALAEILAAVSFTHKISIERARIGRQTP